MKVDQIISSVKSIMGIETLNPMQEAMSHSQAPETILLAPTGSGKTLAFTIPLLSRLKKPMGEVQALILAPSRELVIQIADVIRPLALPLKTVAFYGGHAMADEKRSLASMPDIIIATPGRMLDHLTRHNLTLDSVTNLVLDEYDKSLDLGFHDDMKRICRQLPHVKYITLTSATRLEEMPDFLRLKGPVVMDFTSTIEQPDSRMELIKVPSATRDKLETLLDLAKTSFGATERLIIFVNHRESAERVYAAMKGEGLPVGLYHGGLDQQQRELAIDLLNNGTTPMLVSTDLASRGLDIAGVDAVVHYHMPPSAEAWTHRNGRTARQGASGSVYSIIYDEETVPEYVTWDREYVPRSREGVKTVPSPTATLYFNAGKREKLSRGDIAGFLIAKGGLEPTQVGKIVVKDHYSIAAIPAPLVGKTLAAVAPHKIKSKRVKITQLK